MANLKQAQRQYIYNIVTAYKDTYANVGTVANAFLHTLLAIGDNGIHIKSCLLYTSDAADES